MKESMEEHRSWALGKPAHIKRRYRMEEPVKGDKMKQVTDQSGPMETKAKMVLSRRNSVVSNFTKLPSSIKTGWSSIRLLLEKMFMITSERVN